MSTPINDGGPAFPQPFQFRRADGQPMFPTEYYQEAGGMTLRDYMAIHAPECELMCINKPVPDVGPYTEYTRHERRYAWADKMLAARKAGT